MENALLVGLSKQVSLQRKMDTIANNLANINTNGFKEDRLLLEEYQMPIARHNNFKHSDKKLSFVQDHQSFVMLDEGPLVQTDSDTDIGISGEGYFVVETPQGERYTRNGGFQINNEGTLVTSEGHPVLGQGGAIQINENTSFFNVTRDGSIETNQGIQDQLRIVRFETPEKLEKRPGTLFETDEEALDAVNFSIHQGMIEKSNVQPITEMVQMVEVTRAYTRLSDMLKQGADLKKDALGQLANAQLK